MNPIVKHIKKRVEKLNRNYMAVCCGATGSGKSYATGSFGKILDPEFNIDRVVFSARAFMKLLNSGELKHGSCVMWDEAGVGIPAREWYTISNKVINYVFQTFRRENLYILLTTPSLSYIDSGLRLLFHAYMKTKRIDFRNKTNIIQYRIIQYNPRFNKIYYKRPRIFAGSKLVAVDTVTFKKPSKEWIRDYEAKKRKFAKSVMIDAERAIEKIEGDTGEVQKTNEEIIKEVIRDKDLYLKTRGNRTYISKDLIIHAFNLGDNNARVIKTFVERRLGI